MTKIPIWNGNAPASTPPTWSERVAQGPTNTFATQFTTHSHRNERSQGSWSKQSFKETGQTFHTERAQTRQNAPTKIRKDQEMGELSASLTHQVECNLSVIPSKVTTLVESTDGSNTSKTKLSSNLLGEKNDSARGKWADLNPFEVLNEENEHSDFLRKIPEEIEGGWTFQAKKKTKERVDTIHPESNQFPHPSTRASIVPGGKRGQMYSELHQSFFTSLGIPLPTNVDLCRAQVWLVLIRKKGPQKEVLIHSKNQELPNLPIGIKIVGDGREDWSSKPAMDELIQHITIGLEENVL